ncbi:pyridoxamine 5'-phosphate oxidase family protein [Herbiconiux liangxiaofengii]|uniref:pyridoxamine 5'-phosphate oxidase family protein n=1 Tax=Herbiconiux liangxiaofengii TaxID=3342795 RepID=UPI0035B83794
MARTISTNTTVDRAGMLDFVRPRHRMLVATTRADGRPQMSPVSGGVDDEVLHMPEAADGLVDYYRRIAGEHPDWQEYREAMALQNKSLLRITPTRWSPISTGGFPPDVAARLDAR